MFPVIIILLTASSAYSLTCQEVLDLPKILKVKLFQLKTLKPKDVVECLPHLGRVQMNITEAQFIWDSIIKFHKEISYIPDEVLSMLRWVTVAVKPGDYQNLTLNNIDVITNFGQDYDLSKDQLLAIADRVREDFGAKEPEDYTSYDLAALKQILCVFDGNEIRRIHPTSYKEVAFLIGKLKKCNYDVLEGFASLAIQRDAFGPPEAWKRETICILGIVAKYLPEEIISKLKMNLGSDILKESDKNVTKEEECE